MTKTDSIIQTSCSELVVSLNLETLDELKSALRTITDEFDWRLVIPKDYDFNTKEEIPSINIDVGDLQVFPNGLNEPNPRLADGLSLGVPAEKYPERTNEWDRKRGYLGVALEYQYSGRYNFIRLSMTDGYCSDSPVLKAGQHCSTEDFIPLAKVALLYDGKLHTEDGGSPHAFAEFLAQLHLHEKVKHKYYTPEKVLKIGKGGSQW